MVTQSGLVSVCGIQSALFSVCFSPDDTCGRKALHADGVLDLSCSPRNVAYRVSTAAGGESGISTRGRKRTMI